MSLIPQEVADKMAREYGLTRVEVLATVSRYAVVIRGTLRGRRRAREASIKELAHAYAANRALVAAVEEALRDIAAELRALPDLTPGIIAARAVLGDFVEMHGTDGDPTVRADLEELLVAETMALTESDDEHAAVRAAPRPGHWYGDEGADGRQLTQPETDTLVASELWAAHYDDGRIERARAIVGDGQVLQFAIRKPRQWSGQRPIVRATAQRGGIASDPLVRLIAWRTWGDRDASSYWGIERSVHINPIEIGGDPDRFIAGLEEACRGPRIRNLAPSRAAVGRPQPEPRDDLAEALARFGDRDV